MKNSNFRFFGKLLLVTPFAVAMLFQLTLTSCVSSSKIYKRTANGEGWLSDYANMSLSTENHESQERLEKAKENSLIEAEIEILNNDIKRKENEIEQIELKIKQKKREIRDI